MKTSLILTTLLAAIALPTSNAAERAVAPSLDATAQVGLEAPRARLKNLSEAMAKHDVRLTLAGAESSEDDSHYVRLIHSTHTWIERPPSGAPPSSPPPSKAPH